jgi:hypothetical protein
VKKSLFLIVDRERDVCGRKGNFELRQVWNVMWPVRRSHNCSSRFVFSVLSVMHVMSR